LQGQRVEVEVEENEDAIQLLSDLDLLLSHHLEDFLPHILWLVIYAENISDELEAM